MKRDLALKYQAFVDGELSEREARGVAEAIERDPEAQALVAELRATRTALAGNEPEVTLPETPEFYWSKIEREIRRCGAEPLGASEGRWAAAFAGWRRFLAPVAGVAVMAFLAIAAVKLFHTAQVDDYAQHLAEIENLSEHSTSFSFRSDNMFVVWVQDKDYADVDSQVELIDNEDAFQ
jgi:anti-sigma factor RsiW